MKYFYQKPELTVRVFGQPVPLDHSVYKSGTLYLEHDFGLIVTQKHFNSNTRECYWGSVDPWLANDIYLSKNFKKFFIENAADSDYPIFELRKVMWKLRMKPLQKEPWEEYF